MPPLQAAAHGLPPKPPPPKAGQADIRRDDRIKKGPNKQQGNRDNNRTRENQGSRWQNKKQNRRNRQRERDQSLAQSNSQERKEPERASSASKSEQAQESGEIGSSAGPSEHDREAAEEKSAGEDIKRADDRSQTIDEPVQVQNEGPTTDQWEEDAIFKQAAPTHPPDEVGRPLPETYTEDILLPRKWDAKCVESEFFNADDLEEFVRPIHESKFWEALQYDPAFVYDGKLPCGDLLSVIMAELIRSRQTETKDRFTPGGNANAPPSDGKNESSAKDVPSRRGGSHDSTPTVRSDLGPRDTSLQEATRTPLNSRRDDNSESSWYGSSNQQHLRDTPSRSHERRREQWAHEHRQSPERRRSRSPNREQRYSDSRRSRTPDRFYRSHEAQASRSPRRTRRLSESRRPRSSTVRGRSRSRTRGSSVASDQSRSSSLDSLERELLGIGSTDQGAGTPTDHDPDHPQRDAAPKPKRRRVQVDSAFRLV